jgi:3-oxoacyl-[acyl-carrier-protein] synthase II
LLRGVFIDVNERIVITGLGLVTPLGSSVEQTWRALLDGQFIRDHRRVGVSDVRRARVTHLALHAAKQAITDTDWCDELLRDPQTALIVGTSKGPIEKWMTAPPGETIGRCVSESDSCYGLADLSSQLAAEIGFGPGARATLSGACASGIHALIHAILLLRSGSARRALVVASEASVHPLFVGSFKRLGVLPPEGAACRPFDERRVGFLISEAATALCLEIDSDRRTGRSDAQSRRAIVIDRFCMGADATHLTGSDPDGLALKYLLNRVVDSRPIDLIHAHATGTVLADPIELAAIESVVGEVEPRPIVWSHKGALGHSLGAAGLVSVVLNCMSHRTGIVPGNIQTSHPLSTKCVSISREPVHRTIRRSIAIASGFGGAIGAVSLLR